MQSKENSGLKPVSKQEYKLLEAQKQRDITSLKKKLGETYTAWETYWEELAEKDTTHILHTLHYEHTVKDAYSEYNHAKQQYPDIPPLDERMLVLLKQYEELERLLHEKEQQVLPPIKHTEEHDDFVRHEEHEPEYLDHDERYQELIDANPLVVQLRAEHPELAKVSSIAELEAGVFALNPELVPHLLAIDPTFDQFMFQEGVRSRFSELDPEAAARFNEAEKHRIYQDPNLDPAVERMKRNIHQKTDEETKRKGAAFANLPPEQLAQAKGMIKGRIIDAEFLEFAKAFPQKTAYYAEATPELARARYLLSQQRLIDQSIPHIPTFSYQETLSKNIAHLPSTPISLSQPEPLQPYDKSTLRRSPPVRQVSNDALSEEKMNRIPRGRRKSGGKPNPLRKAKKAVDSARRLANQATQIAQVVTGLQETKVAIVLGIIFFFLILLVIVTIAYILMGGGEYNPEDENGETLPVTVEKSVNKEAIDNPRGGGQGEELTYTINVSYAGKASDVIVTDPLPEGVEFVSAEPKGKTYDDNDKETDAATEIRKIVWSLRDIQQGQENPTETSTTPEPTSSSSTIDVTKYTEPPYNLPAPSGPSDVDYTEDIMENLDKLGNAVSENQDYLKTKFDAKYVDPFLSVIWVGAIEGTFGDPYSWNCQDNRTITINDGCAGGYYSGGWQVGYGIQVSQAASHLEEDFNAAYGAGSATNASKVKEIGEAVLRNSASSSKGQITNPQTFPSVTIPDLVSTAGSGDVASQQAIAILLMDPSLGSITIAQEVAGDIQGANNWRATMEGWSSYYSGNMQVFSNRMKAIAEKYSGVAGSPTGNGNTFANQILKLTVSVKSDVQNTYIVNQASANVIGAKNGSKPPSSNPNQNTPNTSEILGYAEQITEALEPSFWNYYNRQMSVIDNTDKTYTATIREGTTDAGDSQLTRAGIYWCTFLVIDSYNLSGIGNMKPENHLAVMNMIPYFKENFTYLDYDRQNHKEILQAVKPGDAFFIMNHADNEGHTGEEHTGLVKSISVDELGFGELVTYESNSDQTSHTFPIVDWEVQNMFFPLRGFGSQ